MRGATAREAHSSPGDVKVAGEDVQHKAPAVAAEDALVAQRRLEWIVPEERAELRVALRAPRRRRRWRRDDVQLRPWAWSETTSGAWLMATPPTVASVVGTTPDLSSTGGLYRTTWTSSPQSRADAPDGSERT